MKSEDIYINKGKNGYFTIEDGHILPALGAHQLPHLGVHAHISLDIQASNPGWTPVRLIDIIPPTYTLQDPASLLDGVGPK